jgi:hypothetical protein
MPSTTRRATSRPKTATHKAKDAKDASVKTYTVVSTTFGELDGTYKSASGPAAAAKKAASVRFRKAPASVKSIRLTIRQKKTKNTFTYDVTREKLPEPYVSVIAGEEVVREYEYHIKAVRE